MFNTLDWWIVGFYCVGIISLATYVSRNNSGSESLAKLTKYQHQYTRIQRENIQAFQ